MHLALGAAAFAFVAWGFWRWELRVSDRVPAPSPAAAALEPTDRM
jgi:hypothetical protein